MTKFEELLEKLKSSRISQISMEWKECIPPEIWGEYFNFQYRDVAHGLDVDTHRWYETSISVICVLDKLLGIRHVSNIFSESMECQDCGFALCFFEMKEVPIISYQKV